MSNSTWYKGYCKKEGVAYYFIYQLDNGSIVNEKEITATEYSGKPIR